jgi:intermediate peptidase
MSRPFRLRSLPQLRRALPAVTRATRRYTTQASVKHAPALSTRQEEYVPPPPLSTPSKTDDDLLKAHFDVPSPLLPSFQGHSGLFLYGPLQRPSDLRPLTDRVLIHTRAIVNRICAARDDPTGKELRLVVKNLDRLSDLLCGVIDMCELVRNLHPDEEWVIESERSYERLCGFMNELNTHVGMYEVGRDTISTCDRDV